MKSRIDFITNFTFFWPLLGVWIATVRAANWAQSSGVIEQNTVISYVPSPNTPHWSARYGMASIVTSTSNLSSFSYIYVLGGDSYSGDKTQRDFKPGLLDNSWENGYKNDVWRTTGTEWYVKGDIHLRTEYGQKIPRVYSKLSWEEVRAGIRPPLGMTNDEWISCEDFFRNKQVAGVDCTSMREVMWSPRRNHAGVFFKGALFVMGGRAREFVDLPEEESIGGILYPRVQDIPRTDNNVLQQFKTQREVSLYKSDVWKSLDGYSWSLVTPGCKAPQSSLIAMGNEKEGQFGTKAGRCSSSSDCYGAEVCSPTLKTCVCSIWSPREQHAVAAYGDYMYLTGGYASRLYSLFSNCGAFACGETAASDYRYYLSDVWRSSNGESWELITESAFSIPSDPLYSLPLGRGGHSMLVVDWGGEPSLWVIGGRGGDNSFHGEGERYFNDIWTAPLSGAPTQWTLVRYGGRNAMPWAPRTGHGAALDPPSPDNRNTRTLIIYGGYGEGKEVLDDVWSWRLGSSQNEGKDIWREDFTAAALYGRGTGEGLVFQNTSPSIFYVTPDSDLSTLRRFWVPAKPLPKPGSPYELRPYLSSDDIEAMRSVGLNTIRDLADADLYQVLKLRGFDIPQVPLSERLSVEGVCDYKAFATAVVQKCQLNVPVVYDGEQQMPWNVVPVFGGAPPLTDPIAWHGREDLSFLSPPVDDVTVRTADWDGCLFDAAIQGLHGPNVQGIGFVTQVDAVANLLHEVENLLCRQTPGPRVFLSLVPFQGQVYLLGGKESEETFHGDSWYRDARLPSATITTRPRTRTPDNWFIFSANKPGCYFEYRIWDPFNYKVIRPWTPVTFKTSVYWMNWREGGPSNGLYTLYVRAVDPAGNRDDVFISGVNVYEWYYVSPTPWDIIGGVIAAFIFLCILAYLEYRRRVKKAAMERYAMKRMRRKFKAMQRDIDGKAVDWRTLYLESKQQEEMGKRERKKLKKTRDKNAEKREKEKKKREKEKELIKKKLKASKDFKAKGKKDEGSVTTKAVPIGGSSKKSSRVVPSGGEASPLPPVDEGDEELEEKGELKASRKMSRQPSRPNLSRKVLPDKGEKGDLEEGFGGGVGAFPVGEKEQGAKQRKVNKRYKAYEGGGAGGSSEEEKASLFEKEEEEKDDERKGERKEKK